MALPLTVDSLDTIPEALRAAYVPDGEKFKLDAEIEDVTGLKTALQKERGSRGALEKQVKAWQGLGKTPEEIQALLDAQEAAALEKAKKDGDTNAILKQKQEAWDKERAAILAERDADRKLAREAVVGERLLGALAKAGVTEEGAELLPDRLAGRIKFEMIDGKRVLKIMQADGETLMAGSGKDGTATLDDLAKEAVTKYPSLFKASGAGGSGKQPDHKAGGSGVTKKSDFKTEKERSAFVEQHGLDAYRALPA